MNISKEKKNESYSIKITVDIDGEIVGWTQVFIKFQDRHDEPYAYLENVYVQPEHQGKGYGGKLVKLAIEEAIEQGCYKIIGTSKHHKTHVHAFYEKFGFKKYGYAFRMDLIEDSVTKTKDGKEEWTPIPN